MTPFYFTDSQIIPNSMVYLQLAINNTIGGENMKPTVYIDLIIAYSLAELHEKWDESK